MDFFKLKEHNTTTTQEIRAGFTTFLTMLYIVPVNALIMSKAGMPMEALITATALITIISTILNGLWANTPIAMSVGMGVNAYFTFGLVIGMKIPWQSALGVVFISGIIFLILSLTPFRVWIIESLPQDLRRAISAGIGTFIAFIGLKEMGIIVDNPATLVGLGDLGSGNILLGIFGIIIVSILYSLRIKGAFILSILLTSAIAWFYGVLSFPKEIFSIPSSISPIFFELDILSALKLSLIPVIITFLITDMFDSLGTLAGVGFRAGLFNKNSEDLEKTLQVDGLATVIGSLFGTSTTTSFIESASGIEEGGRTGLTAVATGVFFISTLFLLPLFKAIPPNAIYPILVIVGVLMFSELSKINFEDMATAISSFFIVIMMPLTYSITTGLTFGFIAYLLIKVVKREFSDITVGIWVLSGISILSFLF
jgi:AGZA family xanthine/uracil permease-like MFS transporter